MNTANYVDSIIADLKVQVANGGIPLSDACWQTALACIDWSYVYSAWGALCTPAERRKRFNLSPSHTTIKTKCKGFESGVCTGCQWFPDGERTRCFDCRGFTDWVLKQFGFDLYGDIVSTQWNHKDNWIIKGEFGADPVPQNVLVNVFIKSKEGKWTHTGFYYNGATCECSVGVQYFNPMKKNRWTHWAIAACFKSGWTMPEPQPEPPKEPEKEPEKEPVKVSYKTIRKGNYGDSVKTAQTILKNLGYDLGICGVDGDFGQATEKAVKQFQKDHGLKADGIVGEKTWAALLAAENSPAPEVKYTVTVTGATKAIADEIISKYGGTMTAE